MVQGQRSPREGSQVAGLTPWGRHSPCGEACHVGTHVQSQGPVGLNPYDFKTLVLRLLAFCTSFLLL